MPLGSSDCGSVIAVLVLTACSGGTPTPTRAPAMTAAEAMTLLTQLSDDSLRGRMTTMPGAEKAAAMIAREMERLGLEPAADSGYFQRVPYVLRPFNLPGRLGALLPQLAPSFEALDTVPASRRRVSVNVIGVMPGRDPGLRGEHILVDAHYDHIGAVGDPVNACRAVGADSICNGADDDASGVVAVLGIARALAGARGQGGPLSSRP
jgi:hypothetical protein